MLSSPEENRLLYFGVFELDATRGELRKAGRPVRLQQQPFKVLALLASRPNEIVTREEIHHFVWDEGTIVDFEQGLNSCIKQIRLALGDDARTPRYVETLPRRGYRFIAPVQEVPRAPKTVEEAAAGQLPGQDAVALAIRRRRVRLIWVTVVAAMLATLAYFLFGRFPRRPAPSVGKLMLAVLPFENLSGEPNQEYLSDGMTEELITHLGSMDPHLLGVIARTSSMRYKGSRKGIREIGEELRVQYVVEGSVRRAGDELRITAQLILVSDRSHLWAGSYDRPLEDILRVQAEVAHAVADQIRLRLAPAAKVVGLPGTRSAHSDVYLLYLQGRFFWNKRSAEALRKALDYFEQAITIDGNFAPAHAGLADSYTLLAYDGILAPKEAYPKARSAAMRALAISDGLAEAHAALGRIKLDSEWDWSGAEREFRRAIELNPNYVTARQWYSSYLLARDRSAEAIREAESALDLDPLSPSANTTLGTHSYYARQYGQAIKLHLKALEIEPDFVRGHLNLGRAYEAGGMSEAGLAEFKRAAALSPDSPAVIAALAHAFAVTGQQDEAQKLLRTLERQSRERYISSYEIAIIQTGLGETDKAVARLRRACEEHAPRLFLLKVEPRLDILRLDPRFAEIVRCVGLSS